jgi:rubrerythrin
MMDKQTKERILNGLQNGIRTEQDGYHFYMMAAKSTEDEKGKETFQRLAEEELEHLRFLESQRRAILETGEIDRNTALGTPTELSGENPIFSDRLKERIKDAHYEMSALSIGIQLEIESERYYREQAEAAGDPDVSKFYERLADWESNHYHTLLSQHDSLKEDYWAAGGFYPF